MSSDLSMGLTVDITGDALPNIVDGAMDMAFNVSETGTRYPRLYRKLSDNNMDPIAAMMLRLGRRIHGAI